MTKVETDYQPIIDILEEILGDYYHHNDNKGQISFDCPVCSYEIKGLDHGDGKSNLEINYINNVYKCWSCNETHETHGSIYKLIKKFGTSKQLKNYVLLKPEYDEDRPKRIYEKVKLPKEFIPFKNASFGLKLTPHYKRAYNYIQERGITELMIQMFNIGFCHEGEYAHRIIIPSYNKDKELNYFIARSYLTKPYMKYKNPEAEKEIIIWNEHLINWDETVYIVEGAFDSIFLPNSIPLLGKKMSDTLYNLLYENAKSICIVLDPDASNDQEILYHKLNCGKLMGKITCIFLNGDKDIADLRGDIKNYKKIRLD